MLPLTYVFFYGVNLDRNSIGGSAYLLKFKGCHVF